MKISVDRDNFSRCLTRLQGVVEKRNTMPVLANCLIRSGDDKVYLLATDLDITIIDSCPAKVKKPGSVSVNARKLYEIFKELEPGEVELDEPEAQKLVINYQNFVFDLQGINPEEYPLLPSDEGYEYFGIEAEILSEMIDKTIYAAAVEEGRFTLNGIFMEKHEDGKNLRFVATDGHRLALIDREVEGLESLNLEKGVILPKKGMSELDKLIGSVEGKIELGVKENHIALRIGDTLLFMRLVDGEFPEYRRVIPEDNPLKIKISREEFLKSLRKASTLVDEKARSVKLSFKDGKMTIEGRHPSFGIARGECACEFQGEELEIGFNDRYLYDILTTVSGENILMEIKDEMSPVLFKTDDDEKYLCVVMPMRI